MTYTFIAQRCSDLPVAACCRAMGVSTSGFYAWQANPVSDRDWHDANLTNTMFDIHRMSRRSYGSPRVHAELVLGQGQRCSRKRVARLMAQAGIVGIHRRKFRGCTRRDPGATPAEDLVQRNFNPTEPDRLWVMDVTEHPTGEGKVYLAVVLDAWSRQGGGLVDRRPHPFRARGRRRADGHLAPATTQGPDGGPFRPRIAIHVVGLRSASPGGGTARIHGHHRGLLQTWLDGSCTS